MDQGDCLGERFEEHRSRLRAVAYRMLGSSSDADDAVQDAWVRFSRTDTSDVENLGGWLTTVVSRVCLNMLQARRTRAQPALDEDLAEPPADGTADVPADEALLADSIGLAMLVVLDQLSPAERVAFVLHDTFAIPFDEIAPILGRSTQATRQLASRARRRVQGQAATGDGRRQAELVDAFLAAARHGEFEALLAVLDPDVVLHADKVAVSMGASPELRGARPVATFSRRARGALRALVNGAAGAVWIPADRQRVVYSFTTRGDKIIRIDLIADPRSVGQIDLEVEDSD